MAELKLIVRDVISAVKSKLFLYVSFFSLWTLYLLYNNNFFHPFYFWIIYSILVLFVIPIYFIISIEENKTLIRILFFVFFTASIIFAFYLIGLNGKERNISRNEIINGLIVFSLLPVLFYMILKRKFFLSEFGFSLGKIKSALFLTLISSVGAIIIAYIASLNPQFRNVYPMVHSMKTNSGIFIQYELGFLLFFFLWEFFFRGAMLFAFIKSSENAVYAIILQSVIFAFAHLGKPGMETISSFFGGLILGFLIYRIKTFLPAAIIHFALALTMDIISVYFR
ncbi:MAG: hypothetical protein COX48_05625 [bacterium (Candidatus Stahlbacteria) CG23_combo_of_CG06-09_8_20_14_all_34_7]|nr:MAG: hypothetical protein COX48_05625 [bacterium (Candidatus Stahlbacteria) CG23_combo_of_CG06-09_8_20_14_all_34_7]